MKLYVALSGMFIAVLLSGCAALNIPSTANAKADRLPVHVKNQYHPHIKRDPVAPDRKKIILDIKNTSGCNLDLSAIFTEFFGRHYEVVKDYRNAFYIIQADVMAVGQISRLEATDWLQQGWGSRIPNIMFTENNADDPSLGDLAYTIVTDIQIRERLRHAVRNRPPETDEQPVPIALITTDDGNAEWEIRRTRMTSQLATPPAELEGRTILEIVLGMTDAVVRGIGGVL